VTSTVVFDGLAARVDASPKFPGARCVGSAESMPRRVASESFPYLTGIKVWCAGTDLLYFNQCCGAADYRALYAVPTSGFTALGGDFISTPNGHATARSADISCAGYRMHFYE